MPSISRAPTFATRQFLGFTYGDYVGVEAGYIDFGTVDDGSPSSAGQPSLTDEASRPGATTCPSSAAIRSMRSCTPFGKLGMIRWDSEATLETVPLPAKEDGD